MSDPNHFVKQINYLNKINVSSVYYCVGVNMMNTIIVVHWYYYYKNSLYLSR